MLTSHEAARVLGYTVQHIRRLARAGLITGQKLGRDWLIEEDSVDRFVAAKANEELPLDRPGESTATNI